MLPVLLPHEASVGVLPLTLLISTAGLWLQGLWLQGLWLPPAR